MGHDSRRRALPCGPGEFDALASELVARGHAFRLRVWGNSMSPTIRNGDAVVVEPCDGSALRLGDIVFYRRAGGHIAHRLIELRDGGMTLVTRGDAHTYCDPPFGPHEVVGRVVTIEHVSSSGKLARWLLRLRQLGSAAIASRVTV